MRISDWSSDVCSSDLLVSSFIISGDIMRKIAIIATVAASFIISPLAATAQETETTAPTEEPAPAPEPTTEPAPPPQPGEEPAPAPTDEPARAPPDEPAPAPTGEPDSTPPPHTPPDQHHANANGGARRPHRAT